MNRLAWLFPGQGSQYPGMGKELFEQFPTAREVFQEADEVLGYALSELCFHGSADQLRQTAVTQPAILTASIAALRVYREEIGGRPAFAAGHSLGEYSALVSAGMLSFADALRIVERRGALMQQAAAAGIGAMCAIMGSAPAVIEQICRELSTPDASVVVSNYNAPDQTVISGHREAVELAAARLKEQGARASSLPVSAPFHSPLMAAAAEELLSTLQGCAVHEPAWPVLSNVNGKPYGGKEDVVRLLVTQMTAPVRWDLSMAYLAAHGVTAAIEFGPRTVLTNLMKANVPQIRCLPLEKGEQLVPIRDALRQDGVFAANVDRALDKPPASEPAAGQKTYAGEAEHASGAAGADCKQEPARQSGDAQLVIRCMAAAVSTRNRNWDEQEYRQGVIEPYRHMATLQDRLDEAGTAPTLEEMKEALRLLAQIMKTKRVPPTEQQERFAEIIASASEQAEALQDFYREAIELTAGGDPHGTAIDQGQSVGI